MNTSKNIFISCKDYTVSNESFDLILDEELEMLVTSPKPKNEDLGRYYESENYISHTDSKQSFMDKIYQIVKSYTISKKVKLIDKWSWRGVEMTEGDSSEKTLLDIGCGTGDFLIAAQKFDWNVTGVEPNKKAKVIAENKLEVLARKDDEAISESNQKLNYISLDISALENQTFDVITMWHVLEHVPNLTEYITQLQRLLKPNGTLLVAVPNHKSFDAKHYGKFWAAFDVPRHLWHFSQNSIKLLFEKENMKVVKILPMKFDSFYVSLLSEKYKTGKSNPLKAFWIGWKSNLKAIRSNEYSSLIYVIKNG